MTTAQTTIKAAADTFTTGTPVSTPKGEGVVRSYTDGWFKVQLAGGGALISCRAKDLKVNADVTPAQAAQQAQHSADPTLTAAAATTTTPAVVELALSGATDAHGVKAVKAVKVERVKVERVNGTKRTRASKAAIGAECKCGCGALTKAGRHFCQGHDARFHGWMRRLANGEDITAAIPQSALDLMHLVDGMPTTDYDGSAWKPSRQ